LELLHAPEPGSVGESPIIVGAPPQIAVTFTDSRWHAVRNSQFMAQSKRDLRQRAFELAEMVFKLYPRLAATSPAHSHLAHQLLRSVTAIGALLEEGAVAFSRRDMALKYALALREARESNYWARLGRTDARWAVEASSLPRPFQPPCDFEVLTSF